VIIIQRQQRRLRRGRVIWHHFPALEHTIQGKESIHRGPITILEVERERDVVERQRDVVGRQRGVENHVEREKQKSVVEEEDKLIIKFVINLVMGENILSIYYINDRC